MYTYKSHKYNGEFNLIDTPEKAYVLGLFYSDGCISHTHHRKYSYFCHIKLKRSDEEIFIKILELFPFFTLSYEKDSVSLRCNQKRFFLDLKLNGLVERKSFENKNKLRFPNLRGDLISHFIRGYFDGNGSIYEYLNSKSLSKGFSFTTPSYFFIKRLREILYYNDIRMRFYHVRGGKSVIRGREVIFKSLTFSLIIQNKEIIKKAEKFLYKDATLYLERKFSIFSTWIKQVKMKPIKPNSSIHELFIDGKKFIINMSAPLSSDV